MFTPDVTMTLDDLDDEVDRLSKEKEEEEEAIEAVEAAQRIENARLMGYDVPADFNESVHSDEVRFFTRILKKFGLRLLIYCFLKESYFYQIFIKPSESLRNAPRSALKTVEVDKSAFYSKDYKLSAAFLAPKLTGTEKVNLHVINYACLKLKFKKYKNIDY